MNQWARTGLMLAPAIIGAILAIGILWQQVGTLELTVQRLEQRVAATENLGAQRHDAITSRLAVLESDRRDTQWMHDEMVKNLIPGLAVVKALVRDSEHSTTEK